MDMEADSDEDVPVKKGYGWIPKHKEFYKKSFPDYEWTMPSDDCAELQTKYSQCPSFWALALRYRCVVRYHDMKLEAQEVEIAAKGEVVKESIVDLSMASLLINYIVAH